MGERLASGFSVKQNRARQNEGDNVLTGSSLIIKLLRAELCTLFDLVHVITTCCGRAFTDRYLHIYFKFWVLRSVRAVCIKKKSIYCRIVHVHRWIDLI